MPTHARPTEVLLVEDNPADVRLAREAFEEGRTRINLHVVGTGSDALDFLRHSGRFTSSPRPDLVILDLNLPGKSGGEVLADIKSDPALLRIPVMILSSSREYRDLQRAYELHANCYIPKPVDYERYLDVVRSIEHFWFDIVTLPSV